MSDDMPHDHGSQAPAGRVRSDRILIADDDSAMRSLLRAALVRAGFEVEEARDGIEVLQLVRAVRYGERPPIHVMVSDVWMPGRSGLDLLQSLQELGVAIPVILITAFGTDEVHEQGCLGGACAVIDKPFSLETLLDHIRKCLPGHDTHTTRPQGDPIA